VFHQPPSRSLTLIERSATKVFMSVAKHALLTELNYTIWANQLLLETASHLAAEELRRNLGASHTSIIRTLRHMYDAERSWTDNLMFNSIPSVADIEAAGAADQSRPDPTFESLQSAWPQVWQNAHRWLAPLDDTELARELTCRMKNGIDLQLPRWKVLLHMVNHSTMHRGQIITMLRALGRRPPNLDLFTFYQLEPL
jgi:uncharacterized damage-inducible protein DinB